MNSSRGLLYSAFHKFYSALISLERFEKGKNFFDNISYLDNFFSEYRNITFVLQKSLSNTEFKSTYELIRNQYLVNDVGRWFVEKRNEVLKEKPFELEKRILINIYSSIDTILLPKLTFNIDNDIEISTIIDSLRSSFLSFSQNEVMFSVEFLFVESGQNDDLFDNLIFGIDQMKLFLTEMRNKINEDCKLTDELKTKIENINFYRVPKDMLFIDDYVFHCKNEMFEKASRVSALIGPKNMKVPIENLNKMYPDGDLFDKFEMMHLVIYQMQRTLLPTCLILYKDNLFELSTFGYSINTTLYRKLFEISNRIETDNIEAVFFVTEMYSYGKSDDLKKDEFLTFHMIDNDLNINNREYNASKIDDWKYIASVMSNKNSTQELPSFFNPIFQEFSRLKSNH